MQMTSTQYLWITLVTLILLVPQLVALYLSGPRSNPANELDGR